MQHTHVTEELLDSLRIRARRGMKVPAEPSPTDPPPTLPEVAARVRSLETQLVEALVNLSAMATALKGPQAYNSSTQTRYFDVE